MNSFARNLRPFVLTGVCLFLVACTETQNIRDLEQFVTEVTARPGADVEPVPEFVPYEGFIYGAAGLRSPFEVPITIDLDTNTVLNQDVEPDFDRIREPLELQSLSELTMVGMLVTGGVYEALIRDGVGVVHRVRVGNYLGRNHGQIQFISEDQLNLIEIVPSGSGGWVERPQSLALQ